MTTEQTELIELERQKWEAMRTRDGDALRRVYDERAISIGYGSDGSLGARRTPEFVDGIGDLDLRELSLSDFELIPLGDDAAVLTYRAGFRTGRGLDATVIATSVWRRAADGWRTMFFQASELSARHAA
jgi:hypothetical protein